MNRKEKAAETELALKEAAKRVFAARGYLNTKITDITAEAGRAAGSFYNHFSSKEELLEALLVDMFAQGDEHVAADDTHSADFTDRAAIRWHVAQHWHFYREHRTELVALRQAALVNEDFARRLQRLVTEGSDHLRDHLAYIPQAGLTPAGPTDLLVSAIASLLDQFAYTWLAAGGDGSGRALGDDEAIDTLTSLLHRGLAGQTP
ncbi:TetR family transcriptional regulator [Amycolatopsis sp. cg5]|uniref:TetR/AcrR family transcriptional regulator n=1 Tax=Amycolatopsis sp. cg5 TaxID=3238802 RepID=UPI0035261A0C